MKQKDFIVVSSQRYSAYLAMVFLLSAVTCITALYMIIDGARGDKDWATAVSVVSVVWLFGYFLLTYCHFKTMYLFSSAYILCLCVFHLSLIIQKGLGTKYAHWGTGSFGISLELAGWYTVLALSCFGIGLSISPIFCKNRYIRKEFAATQEKKIREVVFWSGVGLLIASVLMFIYAIASYGNLLSYARYEIFRSSADSRGFGVFTMLFPGATALLLLGAGNKKEYIFGGSFALIAFSVFMLSGYRSGALFTALAGIIVWVKSGRRLPVTLAVGLVFVALLSLSVSGLLRTMGSFDSINVEKISASTKAASLVDGVSSLGGSVGLMAHTLNMIPADEPYRMGRTYLTAILGTIPNIGLKVDASNSRQAARAAGFSQETLLNMSPADWMTFKILRDQFYLGQGTGYSGVAEPYLNFGMMGVIVYFVILGVFMGVQEATNIAHSTVNFIFASSAFPFLLTTVRNDFGNFTKPASFIILTLFIWWLASRFFLNKKFYR
jgi:oligosaccharide repeat unit polymerase